MHEQAMRLLLKRLDELKRTLGNAQHDRVQSTRILSEATAIEVSIVREMAAISEEVAAMCAANNSNQKSA